ncbi:hypothetical protein H8N01_29640 [Streptomyces sp. AC536]|uniref:hypothetical protein n=1 Tax=Streptomyces buecherae TaxID=2763006 RepID=UPI00164D0968|nr:hypothetical protein [Streptomyces buecherae]MBC3986632.1 hypothetical protein [Streptomyces buecherae]QNJ40067.1 hypothetical protein H7H31_09410 [Streptomyces buecherae]
MLSEAEKSLGRRSTSDGEKDAWARSLPVIAGDLVEMGLDAVDLMVECELPGVQGEADVILAGRHPETGDHSYVVTELKQWQRVATDPDDDERFIVANMIGKPKPHPAEQTARTCRALLASHDLFSEPRDRLVGMAYLHNAADHQVADLLAAPRNRLAYVFTRDSRGALKRFLRRRLAPVSGRESVELLADSTLFGAYRPDQVGHQGRVHPEFRIRNDWDGATHWVTTVLRATFTADQKSIVLVTGLSRLEASQLAITTAEFLRRAGYRARLLTPEDAYEPPRCDMLLCGESTLEQALIRAEKPAGREVLGPYVRRLFAAAQVPVFMLSTDLPGVSRGPKAFAAVLREAAADAGLKARTLSLDSDFH